MKIDEKVVEAALAAWYGPDDKGPHNEPWQHELMRAALEAALPLIQQPQGVDGFVMVPREPTEARGVVGELVQMGDDEDGHPRLIISTTREAIKASNLVPFSQVEVRNG